MAVYFVIGTFHSNFISVPFTFSSFLPYSSFSGLIIHSSRCIKLTTNKTFMVNGRRVIHDAAWLVHCRCLYIVVMREFSSDNETKPLASQSQPVGMGREDEQLGVAVAERRRSFCSFVGPVCATFTFSSVFVLLLFLVTSYLLILFSLQPPFFTVIFPFLFV